jgi:hypothetical protein
MVIIRKRKFAAILPVQEMICCGEAEHRDSGHRNSGQEPTCRIMQILA